MSIEVYLDASKAFTGDEILGVAIKVVPNRHVGILFIKDGQANILDLAWHHRVRCQVADSTYHWLPSSLDSANAEVVVLGIIASLEFSQPIIPYSPSYSGEYFEPGTLTYRRDMPGDGLTCATFVLAVFESFGIQLVERNTWQSRTQDEFWMAEIIKLLEDWGTTKNLPDLTDHIEAIRSSPPVHRFRPEEVAASVATDAPPLDFETAMAMGIEILTAIAGGIPAS